MSKRNAHAVAARARHAGPMSKKGRPDQEREDYVDTCDECGRDMGYRGNSLALEGLCAPCYLGIRPEADDE